MEVRQADDESPLTYPDGSALLFCSAYSGPLIVLGTQRSRKEGEMNILCKLLLVAILLSFHAAGTKAGHDGVPVLADAIPVRGGICTITAESGTFAVPCEQYIKADGSVYLALYHDGAIAVVRKVEQDGTVGEVVWSIDQQPVKPAVDERGA